MKKKWQAVMVIAALNIVLGAMFGVSAQQVPIAGGYAEISSSDPEVVSAAKYAVRAQGQKQDARISLISIQRAEVQVVAGLNYRMGLRVKVKGKTQNVTAVVYKNLKQRYSLSNWEADNNPTGDASASSNSTIEQLVKKLEDAYTTKALGQLDAERPFLGKVKIVIEHSLAGDTDKDRFQIKEFSTLEQGERWLRSREREEFPARQTRSLLGCKRGLCTYDFDGGILHNQLYLQKISYGLRNRRPYIKTIYLLDGD